MINQHPITQHLITQHLITPSSTRGTVAKIPESLTSSTSKLTARLNPLVSKVRSVKPAVAKESAKSGAAGAKDVFKLSLDYLKQETKGPLAGIGRTLAAGVAGALLIGTGLVLCAMALLRGIQSAFAKEVSVPKVAGEGSLSGSFSWAPYLIAAFGCVVLIGLAVVFIQRSTRARSTR